MKKQSSVEFCKENKWFVGIVLECKIKNLELYHELWQITGFGECEVIGKKIDIASFEKGNEEIIPFDYRHSWKKFEASKNELENIKSMQEHFSKVDLEPLSMEVIKARVKSFISVKNLLLEKSF